MILACKLGGSPSLLWFRAPGRDKLGDNGKKTLLLCLLCSLQTSPWSVGPWLIPTAISKRRHKMSIIFMTRMKDKRVSQVSISSHPSAILEEQAQNTVIKMALQKMNCDRINASARWLVGDLGCWTLRMSNFYHEIKCGEEEHPSTLNRDLKMCTLAEGVGP